MSNYIFDVHTFWYRCTRSYNDVWGLFYIKTSGCGSNFSSFCVVFLCFCLHKLHICVCSLKLAFILDILSACLSYVDNKLPLFLLFSSNTGKLSRKRVNKIQIQFFSDYTWSLWASMLVSSFLLVSLCEYQLATSWLISVITGLLFAS